MLLFLTTNMAAVTSRANQQLLTRASLLALAKSIYSCIGRFETLKPQEIGIPFSILFIEKESVSLKNFSIYVSH